MNGLPSRLRIDPVERYGRKSYPGSGAGGSGEGPGRACPRISQHTPKIRSATFRRRDERVSGSNSHQDPRCSLAYKARCGIGSQTDAQMPSLPWCRARKGIWGSTFEPGRGGWGSRKARGSGLVRLTPSSGPPRPIRGSGILHSTRHSSLLEPIRRSILLLLRRPTWPGVKGRGESHLPAGLSPRRRADLGYVLAQECGRGDPEVGSVASGSCGKAHSRLAGRREGKGARVNHRLRRKGTSRNRRPRWKGSQQEPSPPLERGRARMITPKCGTLDSAGDR